MALNKAERQTIESILYRLRKPRAGCVEPFPFPDTKEQQAPGYEGVSRIYIDTWLIGPLELLLKEGRGKPNSEIEITAKMSDAGMDVYWSLEPDDVGSRVIIEHIYRAMERVRRYNSDESNKSVDTKKQTG